MESYGVVWYVNLPFEIESRTCLYVWIDQHGPCLNLGSATPPLFFAFYFALSRTSYFVRGSHASFRTICLVPTILCYRAWGDWLYMHFPPKSAGALW